MKAVLQRVRSASVSVGGLQISSISRGLLVLIGIGNNDTSHDVSFLVKKILGLKLFPDEEKEDWGWKKNVVEVGGSVLSVSQFTLMGTTKKGTKVDLHGAMPGEQSRILYDEFLAQLRKEYQDDRIQDGRFGAMMDVQLVNDGPVTLVLDSADAPAPILPKVPTSLEFKEKRKADLEAKAKARLEMLARKKEVLGGEGPKSTLDDATEQK